MTKLVFLDTETTGLHPDLHEIWEVGAIVRDDSGDTEHHWFLHVKDLQNADPFALNIGKFWERHPSVGGNSRPIDVGSHGLVSCCQFASEFEELTREGAHLIGSVISFDEERIRRLLWKHKLLHTWHYHIIDIEPMVVGWLAAQRYSGAGGPQDEVEVPFPPYKTDDLMAAIGIDRLKYDRHTALGDAREVRDVWDRIMLGKEQN